MKKSCTICGREFEAFRSAITCGKECARKNQTRQNTEYARKHRRVEKNCERCGSKVLVCRLTKYCPGCRYIVMMEHTNVDWKAIWTEEKREWKRKQQVEFLINGGMPRVSSIEFVVKKQLEDAGIDFIHQKPFGIGIADFFIPSLNTFLFCDGDYWHSRPECIIRDRKQEEFLVTKGYKVVRVTESQIKAGINVPTLLT